MTEITRRKTTAIIGVLGSIGGQFSTHFLLGAATFVSMFAAVAIGFWPLDGFRNTKYVVVLVLTAMGCYYLFDLRRESIEDTHDLSFRYFRLKPANKPSPLSSCPVPPGEFAVYLGSGKSVHHTHNPDTTLIMGGERVLWTQQTTDGTLLLNCRIRDEAGSVIVSADQDQERFWVTPTVEVRRSDDRSRISVRDRYGNVALDVEYVNANALIVKGIFRSIKNPAVFTIISDRGVQVRGGVGLSLGQVCAGSGLAISLD